MRACAQSLGVSPELRAAGYALMCVGYPRSDLVLETVAEDEVYDLQFGRSFAEQVGPCRLSCALQSLRPSPGC